MNVPTYLLAQNVHGPCLSTPLIVILNFVFVFEFKAFLFIAIGLSIFLMYFGFFVYLYIGRLCLFLFVCSFVFSIYHFVIKLS